MIEGQMTSLPAAVGAFKFVPDKHIPFAEWHPGPINHTNEFYQLDDSRNFYGKPFSGSDGVAGIAQDLNLLLEEQAHGPFPINNIQKGVIRIKYHTLGHFCFLDERTGGCGSLAKYNGIASPAGDLCDLRYYSEVEKSNLFAIFYSSLPT
jgi:hypothetical protein